MTQDLKIYVIVSTVVFLFFSIAWQKEGLLNLFIKTVLILLAIWGALHSLGLLGFVVRHSG